MKKINTKYKIFSLICLILFSVEIYASVAQTLLEKFEKETGKTFSAEKGKEFFEQKNPKTGMACVSCHNRNIKKPGKQEVLFGLFDIEVPALSVSANKKVFQSTKKVLKELDNYCEKVRERVCTSEEKGNLIMYFISN
ncbi:MAG: DUF1924 domain-containing protein [Spirochaetia bacterium]|nr:DUF1924 domain-containing protein [Spirochaetia bacterium]